MSPALVITYWASFAVMWVVVAFAVRQLLIFRRANRAGIQARDALEHWARWTMLTVVQPNGNFEAFTIRQLFDSKATERLWEQPHSVSFWHADPATHRAWQEEAIQMYPPRTQENDRG